MHGRRGSGDSPWLKFNRRKKPFTNPVSGTGQKETGLEALSAPRSPVIKSPGERIREP